MKLTLRSTFLASLAAYVFFDYVVSSGMAHPPASSMTVLVPANQSVTLGQNSFLEFDVMNTSKSTAYFSYKASGVGRSGDIKVRLFNSDGVELPLTATGRELYRNGDLGSFEMVGQLIEPGEKITEYIAITDLFEVPGTGTYFARVNYPGSRSDTDSAPMAFHIAP